MGNFLIRKKARADEESQRSVSTPTFTSEIKGWCENLSVMTHHYDYQNAADDGDDINLTFTWTGEEDCFVWKVTLLNF